MKHQQFMLKATLFVTSLAFTNVTGSAGSLSCTFDSNTLCNWYSQHEQLGWTLNSGKSSPNSSYGVTNDHTTFSSSGRYIIVNSNPANKANNPAILAADVPENSGISCLLFYYHMYGRHVGQLTVKLVEKNGISLSLFQVSGNRRDEWNFAEVDLHHFDSNYTIEFHADVTGRSDGDIALDDITVTNFACLHMYSQQETPRRRRNRIGCNFERGDLCGNSFQFTLSKTQGMFRWRESNASAQNIADHSKKTGRGRIAYIKDGMRSGKTTIVSGELDTRRFKCFSFWFYIGQQTTRPFALTISLINPSRNRNVFTRVINSTMTKGRWRQKRIDLTSNKRRKLVVQFEAKSGGGGTFVAIDDLLFSRNSCRRRSRGQEAPQLAKSHLDSRFPSLTNCSFSQQSTCGWKTEGWKVTSRCSEQSGHDHKCFSYCLSGTLVESNQRHFSLVSPAIQRRSSRSLCLAFLYTIRGWLSDSGSHDALRVYTKRTDGLGNRRLIGTFSSTIPYCEGNTEVDYRWVLKKLDIMESNKFNIFIEATPGQSELGIIAVDDIYVKEASCQDLEEFF